MIATIPSAPDAVHAPPPTARILCVDDEANVLKALKRLLRRERYELRTAESAEAALEILDEFSPAVIVSDQRMPGMQGTEFLEAARQRVPDSVRVVLSGFADAATILESINRGHIYRFLTKPWDDENLRRAIAECVRRHRLVVENRRLTSQVEAQNRQLRELNQRLEATVEAHTVAITHTQQVLARVPMPVIGVDSDGRVALANEEAVRAGSPLRGAHIGRPIEDTLDAALVAGVRACLRGEHEVVVLPLVHAGNPYEAHISILEVDGAARGCLVVTRGKP